MKGRNLLFGIGVVLALGGGVFVVNSSSAFAVTSVPSVVVEPSEMTPPLDPENPGNEADPGESPSTAGALRIDYVSPLIFNGTVSANPQNIAAQAQLFFDATEARGNYIQITDLRERRPGWSLMVRQEYQFRNVENPDHSLTGAVLSFDQGWTNSFGTGLAPVVKREAITIDAIGASYPVAAAESGEGNGTWLIIFGASADNVSNQANTLSPVVDGEGKPAFAPAYNKQIYSNSAVTLSIPKKSTVIEPGQYETKLTWILQSEP